MSFGMVLMMNREIIFNGESISSPISLWDVKYTRARQQRGPGIDWSESSVFNKYYNEGVVEIIIEQDDWQGNWGNPVEVERWIRIYLFKWIQIIS